MRIKKKKEVNFDEMMVRLRPFAVWAVWLGAGAGLFFAWRGMERMMFSQNPKFTITEVIVHTGQAVDEDEVRENTKINKGVNIFSFNAAKTSREFLKNCPPVADLHIKKILPSTVVITASDRKEALRVGQSDMVIGRDGLVMVADGKMKKRWGPVPVLVDGDRPVNTVNGGKITDGKIALALEIANTHYKERGMSFRIGKIDIGNSVFAVLVTTGAHTPQIIRLPWDEISAGEDAIRTALIMASETIAKPESGQYVSFSVVMHRQPPGVVGSTTWD